MEPAGSPSALAGSGTSSNRVPRPRSNTPLVVVTQTSPLVSGKSARIDRRASIVSDAARKPVKRCPSKRTTPSAVPTHKYPSAACATARTTLLGSPSSDCHERARKRGAASPGNELATKRPNARSDGSRERFAICTLRSLCRSLVPGKRRERPNNPPTELSAVISHQGNPFPKSSLHLCGLKSRSQNSRQRTLLSNSESSRGALRSKTSANGSTLRFRRPPRHAVSRVTDDSGQPRKPGDVFELLFELSPLSALDFSFYRESGWRGNRTPDTRIFNPLLYQLSYPAVP